MLLLHGIVVVEPKLLYRIGLLFPLDYSVFSMIIVLLQMTSGTLHFWKCYVPFHSVWQVCSKLAIKLSLVWCVCSKLATKTWERTDIVLSSWLLILSTVTWCWYCWHWACVRLFTRLVVAKAAKWNCMKNIFGYSLFCSTFHCSKYFQNHWFNLKNICFFHTWRRINVLSNIYHGG